MALIDDLRKEVEQIFKDSWTTRAGTVVPESENIKLGNDAVQLEGTILYADLTASTILVDKHPPLFAAEIYKTYLHCAAKIIRAEGGTITAYDGDRIMAVYLGDVKNSSAARTALKINYAVRNIINPAIKKQFPNSTYQVQQIVGIDTSKLTVARTGIRGSNDLVWVGRAANYAAKLASLTADFPSRITKDVYDKLQSPLKATDGKQMWEKATWTPMNNMTIYRSIWSWKV
jgi:class 3 adenylate cyclase